MSVLSLGLFGFCKHTNLTTHHQLAALWAFIATTTATKQQQNDYKQAWVNTATTIAKQQNKDNNPSKITTAACVVVHTLIAATIVATKEFVEHSSS